MGGKGKIRFANAAFCFSICIVSSFVVKLTNVRGQVSKKKCVTSFMKYLYIVSGACESVAGLAERHCHPDQET